MGEGSTTPKTLRQWKTPSPTNDEIEALKPSPFNCLECRKVLPYHRGEDYPRFRSTEWRRDLCDCEQAKQTRRMAKRRDDLLLGRQIACGMDEDYRHRNFDTFQAINDSVETARDRAQKWTERYLKRRAENIAMDFGIIFQGTAYKDEQRRQWNGNGIGKTTLMACIANELLRNNVNVRWWVDGDWQDAMRREFDRAEQDRTVMDWCRQCDVLFLDDLGKSDMTPWAANQFFRLINSRTSSKKPIIVSTNLDLDEIEAWVGGAHGAAVRDRLEGSCLTVRVEGKSQRIPGGIGNWRAPRQIGD